MTIGIYCLAFSGTNKVYIGQSSNIERRFQEHLYSINNGHITNKLLYAFRTYGIPELFILKTCSIDELNSYEEELITEFDSINNGFNIYPRAFKSNNGQNHPNSRNTDSKIEEVFFLLIKVPTVPYCEIEQVTKVSKCTIQNIASLKSHSWLKDKYPNEYELLSLLKNNRDNKGSARSRGIVYPSIKDPQGNIYSVENAAQFARDHILNHGHLCQLLNKKRQTHRGWTIIN